ncbi:MAG: fumarylacetoacetate hydrolase family protein [Bacteroidia bacterium]
MKLLTFLDQNKNAHLGILVNNKIYNLSAEQAKLPNNMLEFLNQGEAAMDLAREVELAISEGKTNQSGLIYSDDILLAPIPNPTSCRDGYAFRQHVAAARRNRNVPMIPQFDEYPIMYFTNHNAIQGPGEILCMPDHFQKLDFELEASVVLGKKGRNIKAENADQYIAGYMIMNDMSARALQMEEMVLNLGPAKGKDFSTVIGPYMVTPDELETYKTSAKSNHTGNNYSLDMKCRVNGIEVSSGNMGDMDWTFAEIIERCAYGVDVYPGDVIGSGTVGTGCFLELNGTGLFHDKNYTPQWLKDGDVVEMEITGLGLLKNTIKAVESDFSIFERKKKVESA